MKVSQSVIELLPGGTLTGIAPRYEGVKTLAIKTPRILKKPNSSLPNIPDHLSVRFLCHSNVKSVPQIRLAEF